MGKVVTLSSKYQVVIPKEVREQMGWEPGKKLVAIVEGRSLVLTPVITWEEMDGMLEGADPTGYRDRNDRY